MISTNIHGLIDYIMGVLMIVIPWTYPSGHPNTALLVPSMLGIAIILYSICTKYERGLVKVIPMPFHLALDVLGALFLGLSPWLFNFSQDVFLPHVSIAALQLLIVVSSSYKPFIEKKITETYYKDKA